VSARVLAERTTVERGVVAKLNGSYWGCQRKDAEVTVMDFGPLLNAHIGNPMYCTKPEHMTYEADSRRGLLSRAQLVPVVKTTTVVIEEDK
jgi:hypothetical protein